MTGALKKWNVVSDPAPDTSTSDLIAKQEAQAEAERRRAVAAALARRKSKGQGGFSSLMSPNITPEETRQRITTQSTLGPSRNPRNT